VKIGQVTSADNSLTHGSCAATWPKYDDRRSFDTLSFENGLEYSNFDFSTLEAVSKQNLLVCPLTVTFLVTSHVTLKCKMAAGRHLELGRELVVSIYSR